MSRVGLTKVALRGVMLTNQIKVVYIHKLETTLHQKGRGTMESVVLRQSASPPSTKAPPSEPPSTTERELAAFGVCLLLEPAAVELMSDTDIRKLLAKM